jgi:hypothetical protein
MWVKYINRMASAYTEEDMPGPSVVAVGDARANRRDFYESYKTKFIGDLNFFINWIESGAPVEVIEENTESDPAPPRLWRVVFLEPPAPTVTV